MDGLRRQLLRWHEDPYDAARALDGVIRRATPSELVWIERDYRARHYTAAALTGIPAGGDLSAALDGLAGEYATAVACLLSMDRSGYLREAAVRLLAGELVDSGDGTALAFLLMRLNDVVEPVQAVATRAVAERMDARSAAVLAPLLPLVEAAGARRRSGGVAATLRTALLRGGAEAREALWASARSPDAALRDAALRLLAEAEPVPAVRAAFATGSPPLRHWAASLATASRVSASDWAVLLPLLENDPSPHIRLRGVRARAHQPEPVTHLRAAMFDRDARVRYLARVRWRAATGQAPTGGLYREALDSRPERAGDLIGALGGLADMGSAVDTPRVVDYLRHPNGRVRAEAWRTLAHLDPDAAAARRAQAVRDPSAKVRRQVPPVRPPP